MHSAGPVRYTDRNTAAIVQWQNAALWQRMSWVRNPLAAPISPLTHQRPVPRKPSATSARLPSREADRLFAGTSGWAYTTWKPDFYPAGVSSKKFLNFYATKLNSVEVNYTFTKLPTPEQVAGWLAQVPEGFRFSFKAPQRITHFSRLLECEQHLADFLACVQPVVDAGKFGLILFQLPPNFKVNLDRLKTFLALPALRPLRIAFEFRNTSWFTPETSALLTRYGAALCIAETEDFVSPQWHTAGGFSAYRLRQTGGYKPRQLKALAARVGALAQEREVYVYFKHEEEPIGALNAVAFRKAVAREIGKS